jgi:hypothetical protein
MLSRARARSQSSSQGRGRGGHALISGAPRLCPLYVGLPRGAAGAAACLVAFNHLGDHLGKHVPLVVPQATSRKQSSTSNA